MFKTAYDGTKKLISKKFYTDAEEAQSIVDAFMSTKRITIEEFIELTELVVASYAPAPEVPQ